MGPKRCKEGPSGHSDTHLKPCGDLQGAGGGAGPAHRPGPGGRAAGRPCQSAACPAAQPALRQLQGSPGSRFGPLLFEHHWHHVLIYPVDHCKGGVMHVLNIPSCFAYSALVSSTLRDVARILTWDGVHEIFQLGSGLDPFCSAVCTLVMLHTQPLALAFCGLLGWPFQAESACQAQRCKLPSGAVVNLSTWPEAHLGCVSCSMTNHDVILQLLPPPQFTTGHRLVRAPAQYKDWLPAEELCCTEQHMFSGAKPACNVQETSTCSTPRPPCSEPVLPSMT